MKNLTKIGSLACLLLSLAGPGRVLGQSPTPPLALAPDAPASYTVVRGDTLWGISGRFLRDPWRWPEVWKVNPEIKDPHWIYPGDVLHLGYTEDGQPQITVERGNTMHLSPQVRSQPLDQAVPAIPYEIVAAFMSKPSVIAAEDTKNLPYVVALRDYHQIAGVGDQFYARGIAGADPGSRYNVVRLERKLKDPDDHAFLGYMAVYDGNARVVSQGTVDRKPTELTTMSVVESAREIVEGDKLVTDRLEVPLDFVPHAPPGRVDGKILAVVDGVTTIGQYEVVVINRGHRDGLEPGHVLVTWQHSERAIDARGRTPGAPLEFGPILPKRVQLPDERSGTMMIFRTYDRMSYALMLTTNTSVRVNDPVRNP